MDPHRKKNENNESHQLECKTARDEVDGFLLLVGAAGAVNILYRRDLAAAAERGEDIDAVRKQLQTEYEDALVNPYVAAERGYVDAVIAPRDTRSAITSALSMLRDKRRTLPPRKHGNIPL